MPEETFHFAVVGPEMGTFDVVFVHGLRGTATETWTAQSTTESDGAFWPAWLQADLGSANVYVLGYPASLFAKWIAKEATLYERAKQVLETMAGYGIGTRPILFVTHSLGGLLTKQILRTAYESTDEGWRAIADETLGVFFIATPHFGASLATLLKMFAGGITSPHISALAEGNEELVQLNEACRSIFLELGIDVWVYYEKYATVPVGIVVPQASADPGIGARAVVPIDSNHITIVQPSSRDSTIYLGVRRHIGNAIRASQGDVVGNQTLLRPFAVDGLDEASTSDRRDLLQKLVDGDREHEYGRANDGQIKFAVQFHKNGLSTRLKDINDQLLADVEQRFNQHVFSAIARGASPAEVDACLQEHVIDTLSAKYAAHRATARTISNAVYFLTERCHLRWDKP